MLKADSRAPNSPSDDHNSSRKPITPMAAALSRIPFTALTIVSTELCGNIRESSRTRYADSSPCPSQESREMLRKVSGMKDSSA
jgi:hypothetical protein